LQWWPKVQQVGDRMRATGFYRMLFQLADKEKKPAHKHEENQSLARALSLSGVFVFFLYIYRDSVSAATSCSGFQLKTCRQSARSRLNLKKIYNKKSLATHAQLIIACVRISQQKFNRLQLAFCNI